MSSATQKDGAEAGSGSSMELGLTTDSLRAMVRKHGLERKAGRPAEKLSRYQMMNLLVLAVTENTIRLGAGAQAPGAPAAPGLTREEVVELIRANAPEPTTTGPTQTITVQRSNLPDLKIFGVMHKALPDVLRLVSAGVNVLLVGPAGAGKTELCAQVSRALDTPFTFNSMSAGCTESHIIGRVLPDSNGHWAYQPSPFVRTFRDGGVHLFDEIDAADPNLLVLVNSALANGALCLPFTDLPPIQRHERTIIMAAANTFGHGADAQYVGRNQLDAATLDRFSVSTVFIDYDRDLERTIASIALPGERGESLLAWAWGVREKIEKNRLRRIMSTRTIANAAKILRASGDPIDTIERRYFTPWPESERRMIAA